MHISKMKKSFISISFSLSVPWIVQIRCRTVVEGWVFMVTVATCPHTRLLCFVAWNSHQMQHTDLLECPLVLPGQDYQGINDHVTLTSIQIFVWSTVTTRMHLFLLLSFECSLWTIMCLISTVYQSALPQCFRNLKWHRVGFCLAYPRLSFRSLFSTSSNKRLYCETGVNQDVTTAVLPQCIASLFYRRYWLLLTATSITS